MRISRGVLLVVPVVLGIWLLILSWPNQAQTAAPRLVVVLVVDQLRADYLTLYAHRWRSGFRTLLTDGAYFSRAEYPYLNTVTCPGHATIATGTLPRTHGIILNRWWHREERRTWNCMDDEAVAAISYGGPAKLGSSAKRLLVPTLADELRAQKPGARVVTLALKPRSAVLLAGRGGAVATWLDEEARTFVTSRAFGSGPVDEVRSFIERDHFEKDEARIWELQVRDTTYRFPDFDPAERPRAGWTSLFPHPLAASTTDDTQFIARWERSPFGDAYLGRMAAALLDGLQLGRRETTDYLAISFSALDMLAHDFGPRSREAEDLLMQLDVTIGTLIERLDETLGRDGYVLALSADHGVAEIPKQGDAGQIYEEDLLQLLEQVLVSQWGKPADGPYVESVAVGHIYFARGIFDRWRASPQAVQAVEKALLATPGVSRILYGNQLSTTSEDPEVRAAALGYVPDRSGDLILVTKENWVLELKANNRAASHGTMYEYDRTVPMVFLGGSVKPSRFVARVSPADIAPTLAFVAGVSMPKAEGYVLRDALR